MTRKLRIEPTFWDNQEWAFQHYAELVHNYSSQWIAVADQRVVSHGPNPTKVEEEASQKTGKPKECIALMYVEAGNQSF